MRKILSGFLLTAFYMHLSAQMTDHPNIILIVCDDLNDYVGAFGGQPQIQTPNIDSLAARGVTFLNAFSNSTVCGPSRASFLSGKDCDYTKVYENKSYLDPFRANFTAALGNEEVITLPEHLKNNGYYTFTINKIFHNYFIADYDDTTADPCSKSLSWNRCSAYNDYPWVNDEMIAANAGFSAFQWGVLDDSLGDDMMDYRAVDTAIQFINDFADSAISTCGRPFFLGVGISKPHLNLHIPEQYYFDDYIGDFYADGFNIPYNSPVNAFPPNGLIMPPQPEVMWGDFDSLGRVAKSLSIQDKNLYQQFIDWGEDLSPLPVISDTLTDEERHFMLEESKRANAVMSYIAAVQYVDDQVGRLVATLDAHPEIASNTIVIFISDHGFTLGEKKHWRKSSLWETDIRIPMIIVDPALPGNKKCIRTTGLLDLYPTICDLTHTAYPSFADGSDYLDGHSLVPLLTDPNTRWNRPVLSSVRLVKGLEGYCFPQYSVRDEKFHYIKYATDNNGLFPDSICDAALSQTEEELYEIGANRETDPNEWNNLAYDENYAAEKNWLSKFLPDSELYLQQVYSVNIVTGTVPCTMGNYGNVYLMAHLFKPDGTEVSAADLANFSFKWTNSLTAASHTGNDYTFNLGSIPAYVFAASDRILFYLTVTDLTTGKQCAFELKRFYLNSETTPFISYHTNVSGFDLAITDIDIFGTYKYIEWNFGDGTILKDAHPDTHHYLSSGTYTVTCIIYYGNNCSMSQSATVYIDGIILKEDAVTDDIQVFPNPADDQILIKGNGLEEVSVFSITGTLLFKYIGAGDQQLIAINTASLPAGTCLVRVDGSSGISTRLIEIIH